MPLSVEDKIAEMEKMYEEQATPTHAKFLVYGRSGCGKSHLISTCPGPILVHSFDPGGANTLRKLMQRKLIPPSRKIIIDDRYENEVAQKLPTDKIVTTVHDKPYAYKLWEKEFNELISLKMFERLGTYILDSGTKWMQAMLNEVLQQEKRKFGECQLGDYRKLGFFVRDALAEITSIPCNVVITGHLDSFQDDADGKTYFSLMTAGKQAKFDIPASIDEVYFMEAKESGGKVVRELLTEISGKHECRSRLGGGILKTREEPDIQSILKRIGLPWEDKPWESVKQVESTAV